LGLEAGDPSPATLFIGTEDNSLTLATAPRPRLRTAVEASNPGRLTIRWPLAATGYLLESTDSLSAQTWTVALEQPLVEGTDNVVSIVSEGGSRFFRLMKP
jgi:hypothetical protein